MINLKTEKQQVGYCGPASLKIVLDYYGIHYSQEQIAKKTNASHTKGCAEKDMAKFAKKLGLKAYIKQNSSIKELKILLKQGIPVIVDWFSPEQAGHYCVVAGIKGNNIFLSDPHFGKIIKHKISWFEERWFDMPFANKPLIREIIVIRR